MKYKYIGTVKQLEEHGFDMEKVYHLIHGNKSIDSNHDLYVVLTYGKFNSEEQDEKIIQWNDDNCTDDIRPYIQDLIDAKLVEVKE